LYTTIYNPKPNHNPNLNSNPDFDPDPNPNPNPNRNPTVATNSQMGPRDPQIVTVQNSVVQIRPGSHFVVCQSKVPTSSLRFIMPPPRGH